MWSMYAYICLLVRTHIRTDIVPCRCLIHFSGGKPNRWSYQKEVKEKSPHAPFDTIFGVGPTKEKVPKSVSQWDLYSTRIPLTAGFLKPRRTPPDPRPEK